jgi:hypothetical protein
MIIKLRQLLPRSGSRIVSVNSDLISYYYQSKFRIGWEKFPATAMFLVGNSKPIYTMQLSDEIERKIKGII